MARNPVNVRDVDSQFNARVLNNRGFLTADTAIPIIDRARSGTLSKLNRAYRFTDSLTGTSSAMNVDGSVTPVEFEVPRVQDRQLNFVTVRMVIESNKELDIDSADRKVFGAAGLLANGLTFQIFLGGARGTFDLFPFPVTKSEDLVLFAKPGSIVNLLRQGVGAPDTLIVELTIASDLILAHIGSSDQMFFTVNDDLTALGRLEAVAFGHEDFR